MPRRRGAAIATAALLAAPAWAQDGEDGRVDAQLPAVKVSASAPASDLAGASLNRLTPTLRETPQSLTVIDQQRMAAQNLRSLDDVMQQAPGVTVQPYQQLTTAYYVRGFKVDSFQQDGVPVLLGSTASPPQDMAMYERVEMLRGASGLLGGTGNPAATVNLVPKRPQRAFAGEAALAAGSWNRYRGELDLGGPLNASGSVRARMVATYDDRAFFYDVADQRAANLYGIAELDLAPGTTASLGLQHQRIRSTPNMAGVPFSTTGQDLGLPRSKFLDTAWGRFDWDTTRVTAGLEHHFGNGWEARVAFNHLTSSADMRYAASNGAVNPATGAGPRLMGGAYQFDNDQNSVDAYAKGQFGLLGRQHDAMVGLNFQQTDARQAAASFVPPLAVPVNVWAWNPYGVAEPGTSAFASPGSTRTTQGGLYGMVRLSLTDRLKLLAGARVTRWKQRAPTSSADFDARVTPYGGLVFDLTPQWAVYASTSQILQPQTQLTASGDTLAPIKGRNDEAGIKGELADGRLNVSAALFRIRQSNRAIADPAYPCAGSACYYIADGEVESRGFETEVSGRIGASLNLSASYTFNTTEYLRDATAQGQAFASFVPRHIARLWADYILPFDEGRWSVGAGVQAQSAYTVKTGGVTLRQGGYALLNLRAGYRFSPKTSLALNVGNVFDRRYYQSLSSLAWNNRYGEPLSAMLTLRTRF
ncbi:outer membrane receptor for ferric coprogen and ferric-rhodotorulic acid [Cupriavidus agavae]|uniref:Outer membrane receptor for ferric coprogen and ferric-rhodotorulic acid n=2 Tax=Cupriavidus agavae TaxID=1001822 RepID=A0A4Q7RZT9_9BURK|nr:outer membrane receptor for ferric coprogen and ferric-rhodotorulic acid [Cupriavidus agavae]